MKGARKLRLGLVLVLAFLSGLAGAGIGAPSGAEASVDEFRAGNIISDAVFYDSGSMSPQDIQRFLETRLPRCTIGDPGRLAGTPWPANNSSIAEACLRDYFISTSSRPGDLYCGAYVGSDRESAAQIISKVAQACGISPRVLLVLLEKEQSLVTDSWPTVRQFDVAMGANCPDSGPNWSASCDPRYYGFAQQVYRAAWLLKYYKLNPLAYAYRAQQWATIQWHPNPACGTSQVFIENQATAALYIYTPYRPNQAALDAGWGLGDSCSTYGNRNFFNLFRLWFGSTQYSLGSLDPVGRVETESRGPKQVSLSGYAFDPETSAPIDVHLYVDGPFGVGRWGGAFRADRFNSTVAARFPAYGANHGFVIPIQGLSAPTTACIYGINVGQGSNVLIECRSVSPATGAPYGNFEALTLSGTTATARGWVIDPDDVGSVTIHAYLNGEYPQGSWFGETKSEVSRPDVERAFPLYGSRNGFSFQFPAPVGTNDLCLYAIDREGVANKLLGCRTISTASGPPRGNLEEATPLIRGINLRGWALDPDTPNPISLHVYVDGRWGGAYSTGVVRPDVGAAFPGYGPGHGFSIGLRGVAPGARNVCVFGIDVRGGVNTRIGCRTVQVPGGAPYGAFDEVVQAPTGEKIARGWALDPDSSDPIHVHAYLNNRWFGSFLASASRPDVAAAIPGAQSNSGFSIPSPNEGTLCIYAINVGSGTTNSLLGCRVL